MKKYNREEVYKETLNYFKGDTLATDAWINKYALKDSEGNIYEKSPDDMHKRISSEFSRIENKYQNPIEYDKIYELLKDFKYIIPQGSPMSGIGNNFQIVSLSNCYVVNNEFDSYGSIMRTDEEIVQLCKRRGGVGTDLSHIRPKNTSVNNAAITSTGVVPFMERFSNSIKEVAQNGRRGALMISISINHPDSEDFINAKMEEGKVTGANVSVKITDDFMNSVVNNTEFFQQFPIKGEPIFTKKTDSKALWDKIIYNAWKSAEPGILFWDTIIKESIPDCYEDLGFRTVSTNPCIVGDSMIAVADGRNAVSIKQLVEEGRDVPVYSKNNEGKVEIKWGRNPRLTGVKKEVWKLLMDDGSEFIATPNHNMFLKNNTKIELKDLKVGDSLSSFYSFDSNNGYRQISSCGQKMVGGAFRNRRQYRIIYEFFKGLEIDYKLYHLHHKDFDNKNDSIDNLELMPREEHNRLHSDRILGDKNPYHRMSDEWKFNFASHPGEKNPKYINVSNKELIEHAKRLYQEKGIITKKLWIEYAKEHGLPQFLGNVCRFKSFTDFKNQVIDNHKVVSVEFHGYEDVYNLTVDDNHNYIVLTSNEDDKFVTSGGICVKNCGEIPLCDRDSCRLIALNLFSYVVNPFTKDAYFDFDLFNEHARIAMRFMDDLIDLEIEKLDKIIAKIQGDKEPVDIRQVELDLWLGIREKCQQGRRTGLGVTAEGDMLAALGIRYGTKEGTEFSVKVHKSLAIEAYRSSGILASERGAFTVYEYDREKENPFIKRLIESDPSLDVLFKTSGRRNIACLTCAPTGTVSLMTQTTSGIEPVYLPNYERKRKVNPTDKSATVSYIDPEGVAWEKYMVFHHKFADWLAINGYDVDEVKKMNNEDLDKIVEKSPYYKATANDVDWVEKVRMQGEIQKWIDHSISVTINLPGDATVELVDKVYRTAWESGCKGVTCYRDGSRQGVLTKKEDKKEEKKEKSPEFDVENNVPKRPKSLECDVIFFTNNREKWVACVGLYEERPWELFTGRLDDFNIPNWVKKGQIVKLKIEQEDGTKISQYNFIYKDKAGYNVIMEGLNRNFDREYWNVGKMLSALLRHRMPIQHIISLVDTLKLEGGELVISWRAGVKRVLKSYIDVEEYLVKMREMIPVEDESQYKKCKNIKDGEECGGRVIKIGGCEQCIDCGHSEKCGA